MISQTRHAQQKKKKNHLRTLNTVVLAKTRQISVNLLVLLLVNVLGLQVISNLIEITSVSSGTLLTIVVTDTMMSSLAAKSVSIESIPNAARSIYTSLPSHFFLIRDKERGRKIFD